MFFSSLHFISPTVCWVCFVWKHGVLCFMPSYAQPACGLFMLKIFCIFVAYIVRLSSTKALHFLNRRKGGVIISNRSQSMNLKEVVQKKRIIFVHVDQNCHEIVSHLGIFLRCPIHLTNDYDYVWHETNFYPKNFQLTEQLNDRQTNLTGQPKGYIFLPRICQNGENTQGNMKKVHKNSFFSTFTSIE